MVKIMNGKFKPDSWYEEEVGIYDTFTLVVGRLDEMVKWAADNKVGVELKSYVNDTCGLLKVHYACGTESEYVNVTGRRILDLLPDCD